LRITGQCVKIRFSLRPGRFPTDWLLMIELFFISGRPSVAPALRKVSVSISYQAGPAIRQVFPEPGELHVIA
jgi:hypothetical protein